MATADPAGRATALHRPPERTWADLVRTAAAAVGSPPEARWIVERASGWDGAELARHLGDAAPARPVAHVEAMVARRTSGEPLQYVLGRWAFRGLELFVDRRVLIPRPETEVVAGAAIEEAARSSGGHCPVVVDLGTGAGPIALAVATEVAGAEVWATDASAGALAVARANVAGSGRAVAGRIRLVAGWWWDALPRSLRGGVDVAVSNPPYVGADDSLPEEVAAWEPATALRAGPTGLEALEAVVTAAPAWLRRPGSLVVEIAPHQAPAVTAMAQGAGFVTVEVRPDLAGRPRVVVARR